VDRYLAGLYEELDNLDQTQYVARQLLADDMRAFIIAGGKKGRQYIHHFVNELKGLTDYRCMFCFQFFSSHSSRNNHLANVHRDTKDRQRKK